NSEAARAEVSVCDHCLRSAARRQLPGWLSVSCGWIHCEILARITTDPPAGSMCPAQIRAPRRPARCAYLCTAQTRAPRRGCRGLGANSCAGRPPRSRARAHQPSAVGVAEVADEGAGHLGEGTGGLEDSLQALVGHPAL